MTTTILRQKTSFGPGVYRGKIFDLPRLKSFVDGTNAAIAAGIPIPLLKRHAPIDANDQATMQFSKEEGAGWVKKVTLDKDGNLGFEAEVPQDTKKMSDEGKIRFTSPEFRPGYTSEKAGVYSGPVIRHFAFTPKPGNPHQSPLETMALSESAEVWQFAEEERQPLPSQHAEINEDEKPDGKTKIPEHTDDPAETSPPVEIGGEAESLPPPSADPLANNPDMPPKVTDKTKMAAVMAGLNQKGIVLPSDFDFENEAALDILLAALNSSIKAEQEAEAKEPEPEESPPVQESTMPFTEQELAAIPAPLRSKFEQEQKARKNAEDRAKAAELKAQQFAEQERTTRNNVARDNAVAKVKAARIPPVLRGKLLAKLEPQGATAASIQFSEGEEQPMFTAQQIAEMVADSFPPSMQFDENGVVEAEKPPQNKVTRNPDGTIVSTPADSEQFFEKGEVPSGHVTPERARELVSSNPALRAYMPNQRQQRIGDLVAAENQRVPSRVMNP